LAQKRRENKNSIVLSGAEGERRGGELTSSKKILLEAEILFMYFSSSFKQEVRGNISTHRKSTGSEWEDSNP